MDKNKIEEFEYKEPTKGNKFVFKLVDIDRLVVSSHQRKPSEYHIKHIISSIERIGFITPLIVVESKDKYTILDGQHRFLAAKKIGIKNLPVIVVPEKLAKFMMNLNIEKELNIREKSFVAINIYKEYYSSSPEIKENDPLIVDSIEHAHYVTLGFAYEKMEKFSGSSIESLIKKCDYFLDEKLKEAIKKREDRSEKVIEAFTLIKSISQKIKDLGAWHPFIYQQITSFANPYKRKRASLEFDEVFSKFIENLKKAEKNPKIILKEKVESFE
ncbi:MAG: ParB N-terminal domain-containing protein [Candidatus Aenigmarchaeota archaeon]|nr:ParB N-terminal domain-containing protein [Candidatus Aenigmarchaeota archaeon]MCX8179396.1 ParB N-terminal domain-containing protein [Candidatus Aenigmarchaeota archaeon]